MDVLNRFSSLSVIWMTSLLFFLSIFSCAATARSVSFASRLPKFTSITPAAVFGEDDRQDLPSELEALKRSIGLVYSNRARSVCTGFCVAPNVVATASHCLFRTEGEQRPLLRRFRFSLKASKQQMESPIEGYSTGNPAQFVIAGSRQLRVVPPIDATRDWALMRLERPICKGAVLKILNTSIENLQAKENSGHLIQVAFHNDFADWRLAYSGACETVSLDGRITKQQLARDFVTFDSLFLHGCDTGGASSGSPLFWRGADNDLHVVAINVGTYMQTRMLTERGSVVRRYKAGALANTALEAQKIQVLLSYFSKAKIIRSASDLRDLQLELKRRGFYNGAIDGSFGPATRLAIQNYRGISGEGGELAGLPTQRLLNNLLPDRATKSRNKVSLTSSPSSVKKKKKAISPSQPSLVESFIYPD